MERVPEVVDIVKAEEEVRSFWREEQLLHRIMQQGKGKPRFRYLEGPPTANSFMHVGHARGRTIKDVYLRWKTMQGYDVWRQAGWDCQGLPAELEVEKNLKLESKRDIEDKVGVENFIALCKQLVDSYVEHWRTISERLGLSLDYDSAYETRRDAYIETGWATLKTAYERGMLVEDFKVIPFCPRCETPLSGHEVAQGYDTASDPSIYVKFPVHDKPGHFLLIWTTTPWTLVANEAVAVHPEVEYSYVRVDDEYWLIASPLIERVMEEVGVKDFTVGSSQMGAKLVGLGYDHPFADEVPAHRTHTGKNDHRVLPAEYVTLDEGTGCVHTAPGHGPDDFQLGKKYDLPIFCPVSQNGKYTGEAGVFQGKPVKEADNEIIQKLTSRQLLAHAGKIEHTYPFCWRCDTPLLYRADLQWFLRADPIRKEMLDENLKVKWRPDWAGGNRFHVWLENAGDWCISRARYWGTPLNVWTCQSCRHRLVIGSKRELQEKAGKLPAVFELHRPWVDRVELKCEKCGSRMKREPAVLDAWFDSGVAHTAGLAHLTVKPELNELYPYEFITEAIDQTRGWFYSLLFTGVLLYGRSPYQSVLCQEFILDSEGRKMSKSRGNTIWAKEALEKEGSDPVRLYLLGVSSPWDAVPYRNEELELYQRKLRIILNIFTFATTYMTLDRFKPSANPLSQERDNLSMEDQWILSRTQSMIAAVTDKLEDQRPDEAVRSLFDFAVEDLSREYLRSVKRRVWLEEDSPEKLAVYATLHYALERFLRIMAPFAPHLSEWLYQRLVEAQDEGGKLSVHLTRWPAVEKNWLNPALEEEMAILQEVAAATANARQKAKLKLRWPVRKVTIIPLNDKTYRAAEANAELLSEAVNAQSIEVLKPGDRSPDSTLTIKPNLKSLGRKYRKSLNAVLEALGRLPAETIHETLQRTGKFKLDVKSAEGEFELSSDDISLVETTPAHYSESESKNAHVWVDTRRDRGLESEAVAREIVRRVQSMRKEMGLRVEEYVKVKVLVEESDDLARLRAKLQYLKTEVRAKELSLSLRTAEKGKSKAAFSRDWEFDGRRVTIRMERAQKGRLSPVKSPSNAKWEFTRPTT